MIAGVQISTFKPFLETAEGVRKVFGRIAEMKCGTIQIQGIDRSVSIDSTVRALRENGLYAVSVQEIYSVFEEDTQYYTELNSAVGARWLTVSRIPGDRSPAAFAEALRGLSRSLETRGQRLAFHPVLEDYAQLEELLDRVPEMDLCLDLYHLWRTGLNMPEWIRTHRARIPMVHFKDGIHGRLVPAGQGEVDFSGIRELLSGGTYAFVEQETWDADPFDCVRTALEWLECGR